MKKVKKANIQKIEDYLWEIPKSFREDMRVPARILANEILLNDILEDRSLNQLVNVATLPGIQKASWVMPDVHEGYGFPIGGVAATSHPEGAISPGGIGYDINCGVRLQLSELHREDVEAHLEDLSKELNSQIPSGMGKSGHLKVFTDEMNEVLQKGAEWAIEKGYGSKDDLKNIESNGRLPDADPNCVSTMAKNRGADQLGTLGSGNHFTEVDYVAKIYDTEIAKVYGLQEGQVVVLIHTGSRGLGHQVATDYIRAMMSAMPKYNIQIPDRELTCVPFNSEEGQNYYKAMCAAANFAWCNRQVISGEVAAAWEAVFGKEGGKLRLLYDVAHNIAKIETHIINNKSQKVIVHRKGATRAFGPGSKELPDAYQHVGQPVIIPGSMGTCSYVLAGAPRSEELTFGSCCHGAGRRLSRTAVKKQVNAPVLKQELREKGIFIEGSYRGIAEEAPIAYKDVDLVVDTVETSGIAKKVAKLKPLVVIKG